MRCCGIMEPELCTVVLWQWYRSAVGMRWCGGAVLRPLGVGALRCRNVCSIHDWTDGRPLLPQLPLPT